VALAATLGCVVASFLPWGRSGSAHRSSYQLVAVAGRLGVLSDRVDALALFWFALPMLVVGAWIALAAGLRTLSATLCVVVGALCVLAAVATYRSPLVAEAGAALAAGCGGITVVTAVTWLAMRSYERHDRRRTRRSTALPD
jgi:hypothetical protein